MTKMQKYYEDFAKKNIGSIDHLNSFCAHPETVAKFSPDELAELMNLWSGGKTVSAEEEMDAVSEIIDQPSPEVDKPFLNAFDLYEVAHGAGTPDYAAMTKDQIEEVVMERHNIDVDRRLNKGTLVDMAEELDNL